MTDLKDLLSKGGSYTQETLNYLANKDCKSEVDDMVASGYLTRYEVEGKGRVENTKCYKKREQASSLAIAQLLEYERAARR